MHDIAIDKLLLRELREDGLSDRRIAAAGVAIAKGRHNARPRRELGQMVSGDVTWSNGMIEAPVHVAQGVHWCGGTLQIVADRHMLPDMVAMQAVGRRLRDVVDHDALPDDAIVTAVSSDQDRRFHVMGQSISTLVDVPRLLLLHTDAQPTRLRVSALACATHGLRRCVFDAATWQSMPRKLLIFNAACLLITSCIMTYIARVAFHATLPWAALIGAAMGAAMFACIALVDICVNAMERIEYGSSHQLFLLVTQNRQREQGMWGRAEEAEWLEEH